MKLRFVPVLALAALSGCASYRYLPLPPETGTPTPLSYQATRALVFGSTGDDSLVDQIFSSPDGATTLLAVMRPASGVLASGDGGASFHFTAFPLDLRATPRVLREVIFDPADANRLYARAFNGLYLSIDRGQSWSQIAVNGRGGRTIDAFALGPDGTLYIGQGDALYATSDQGATVEPVPLVIPLAGVATIKNAAGEELKIDPVRIRSILVDPAHAKTVYVSIEPEPPAENFQRRLIGLLDDATEEGRQARALLNLPGDRVLEKIAFGDRRAGVYVTHDGGRLWQKSPLAVDSWLTAHDGAIYAVAAEPLVTAAGLASRYPDLARAIGAQLHENAFDFELLRRACKWPGRDALIASAPAAPIFRSSDEGKSWSRLVSPDLSLALALRRSFEQQRSRDAWPLRPLVRGPEEHDLSTPGLGPDKLRQPIQRNGLKRREPEPVIPPDLTVPLLSLLDPTTLLGNVGPSVPLSGVSGVGQDAEVLWAYAPTEPYWVQLTEALLRATRRQGELSQGLGIEAPASGNGFQLLRSDDAGKTWTEAPATLDRYGILTARGIAPYPERIAASALQALFLMSGHDKAGHLWNQLLREPNR
jgi:hypothetical protein